MAGKPRLLINPIRELLTQFPCVALLGARQVGKSTLLQQVLPETKLFDLEKSSDFNRIHADPEFFLQDNPTPLILDEAQLCPALFAALRVKIDENREQNGQYLMSGSSSPELLKGLSESLAGRIAIVEVGTLTPEEAYEQPLSDFYTLLVEKQFARMKDLKPVISKTQLEACLLYGGYPEAFLKHATGRFYDIWMENYISTYIGRDIRRLFPSLQIQTYQRFIKMLMFASGEIINYATFARSLDVSQPTVKSYFEIAQGTFLWRNLPSYQKNVKKRVLKMHKGYVRDVGLINHQLGIHTLDDLKSHPMFGAIWEVFIIEQLIKKCQTQLVPIHPFYYRTHGQAEIDLLLSGRFGLIPIEIKAGTSILPKQLSTMKTFMQEHACEIGIFINQAKTVESLAPNILQIPATFI